VIASRNLFIAPVHRRFCREKEEGFHEVIAWKSRELARPRLLFSGDDQARAVTFAGISTLTMTATMTFNANASRPI